MVSNTFKKYLEEVFGPEGSLKVLSALNDSASVSVRLNPSKTAGVAGAISERTVAEAEGDSEKAVAGAETDGEVPWCSNGLFLKSRPTFTLDPLFHAGAYYVQDSSSMFVGYAFREVLRQMAKEDRLPLQRNIRVLDLCAAPGGKTTDLAASLRERFGDRFLLVSNEVMKNRAGKLADNVALWGDPNVAVTSADPAAFAKLEGFFDIILADVPCSGEGMFRKDEQAVEQWSEETVSLCAARQRRILADVWPSLAPAGIMIYSTCTFNNLENDGNVGWASETLGAEVLKIDCQFDEPFRTKYGFSLAPGYVRGEGQYCAVLQKNGTIANCSSSGLCEDYTIDRRPQLGQGRRRYCQQSKSKRVEDTTIPEKEIAELFSVKVSLNKRNELIIAIPKQIEQELGILSACVKPLSSGVAVGQMKAGKLVPSADLALSTILRAGAFADVELDKKTALEFLHLDNIVLEGAPLGILTLSYRGRRLGFVKNLGRRCNSLMDRNRRILMDLRCQ